MTSTRMSSLRIPVGFITNMTFRSPVKDIRLKKLGAHKRADSMFPDKSTDNMYLDKMNIKFIDILWLTFQVLKSTGENKEILSHIT